MDQTTKTNLNKSHKPASEDVVQIVIKSMKEIPQLPIANAASTKSLILVIHHMKIEPKIEDFLSFASFKSLESLKLVIYDCKSSNQNPKRLVESIDFKNLKNLKSLKLNFGCMTLNSDFLKILSKQLKHCEQLETFYLSIPNAGLSPNDLDIIDTTFIKYDKIKHLGFNFLKVFNDRKSKLNLGKIGEIITKIGSRMESLSLNVSQNELDNVEALQTGLLDISDAKKIKVKLIMYNCLMNQKPILLICDTMLKFDNLEEVKLDIRENYHDKKEYPSCKVISYCETLICAFRHMLEEGDDQEAHRKYKVCY